MRSLWLLAGFISIPAWACPLAATTELERLYCELQAKGASLPAARDFKANTPQIQALLLKRLAERHGLALPKLATPHRPEPETTDLDYPPEPNSRAATAPVRARLRMPEPNASAQSGKGCSWQPPFLHCQSQRYQLAGNRANRQLASGSLGPSNRIGLQPYQGDNVNAYLARQYPIYLGAMLRIGLGGSTLSFNSFQTIFEQNRQQGLAFDQRFETMYGYLKEEKRRNDGARAASSAGLNPAYCQQWDSGLATCPADRHLLLIRVN